MTDNPTDQYLDMNDLCDQSLEALIQHYLSLKKRMPNNLSVRERLVELQDEKFNRQKQQQEDNQWPYLPLECLS